MSNEQKVWFIYMTDHHEGPFTAQEVAEKAQQGLANAQSLAWKDGMSEWVALETIPELHEAISSTAAPSTASELVTEIPAENAPGAEGDGVSLAELLSSSQKDEDPSSAAATLEPASLSIDADTLNQPSSALSSFSGLTSSPKSQSAEPGPNEKAWTMNVDGHASGMYSLQELIAMAAAGDIPSNATLWHTGWSDFQPVTSVPQVASARRAKSQGIGGVTGKIQSPLGKRGGLAPITAAANVGNDDPTDPNIRSLRNSKPGLFLKMKQLFKKKEKKSIVPHGGVSPMGMGATKAGMPLSRPKKSGLSESLKRVAGIFLLLAVLGGAGAGYFFFFMSPIPSDLDVIPDDLENMQELVKSSIDQGGKLYLALARGTEDSPADDTSPKFYVATNMPEGTQVSITVEGKPGTLVNKTQFEKSYTATTGSKHMAIFEQLSDDGKPLPMGMYKMKVTAEGATPFETERFLGGRRGPAYDRRLKQYTEKLQADYDKEVQELREFVSTLKALHTDFSQKLKEYAQGWSNPSARNKIVYDWKTFNGTYQLLLEQLDAKVRGRENDQSVQKYYPRILQDLSASVGQLKQAVMFHAQRLSGGTPAKSPDEMDGLIQAALLSLEQSVANAIVKTPADALNSNEHAPDNATVEKKAP